MQHGLRRLNEEVAHAWNIRLACNADTEVQQFIGRSRVTQRTVSVSSRSELSRGGNNERVERSVGQWAAGKIEDPVFVDAVLKQTRVRANPDYDIRRRVRCTLRAAAGEDTVGVRGAQSWTKHEHENGDVFLIDAPEDFLFACGFD
jgi:hypothetical protein